MHSSPLQQKPSQSLQLSALLSRGSPVKRQIKEDSLVVVLIAAPEYMLRMKMIGNVQLCAPSWNRAITATHPHSTNTPADRIWGLKYSIVDLLFVENSLSVPREKELTTQ